MPPLRKNAFALGCWVVDILIILLFYNYEYFCYLLRIMVECLCCIDVINYLILLYDFT